MLLFIFLRANNLAVNFLRDSLSFKLAALAFSLNGPVAECFSNVLLNLRAAVLGVYYCVELLFIGLNVLSVCAESLNVNQVFHFSRDISAHIIERR